MAETVQGEVIVTYEDVLKKVTCGAEEKTLVTGNKVGLAVPKCPPTVDEDSDDSEEEGRKQHVKGQPKSGRFWKSDKKRFRTMVKTPGLATKSLEKKLALRNELKRAKELTREILSSRKEEKEAKKERRRANIQKAEENKKKAEIVQVIKNSAKLKKMKKKQLRNIEKRDTTNLK